MVEVVTGIEKATRWHQGGRTAKGSSTTSVVTVKSVSLLVSCQVVLWNKFVAELNLRSSCLHMWHISTHYGSSSYTKVIGSRSRSQLLFLQCKNAIGSSSRSIKHKAMMSACTILKY